MEQKSACEWGVQVGKAWPSNSPCDIWRKLSIRKVTAVVTETGSLSTEAATGKGEAFREDICDRPACGDSVYKTKRVSTIVAGQENVTRLQVSV